MEGFIYLIRDTASGAVKIGYSVDPQKRLKEFWTGNINLRIEKTIPGTIRDEKLLHRVFAEKRIQNEWFALDDSDIENMESTLLIVRSVASTEADKPKRIRPEYVPPAEPSDSIWSTVKSLKASGEMFDEMQAKLEGKIKELNYRLADIAMDLRLIQTAST